jgi:hypothetical protein
LLTLVFFFSFCFQKCTYCLQEIHTFQSTTFAIVIPWNIKVDWVYSSWFNCDFEINLNKDFATPSIFCLVIKEMITPCIHCITNGDLIVYSRTYNLETIFCGTIFQAISLSHLSHNLTIWSSHELSTSSNQLATGGWSVTAPKSVTTNQSLLWTAESGHCHFLAIGRSSAHFEASLSTIFLGS